MQMRLLALLAAASILLAAGAAAAQPTPTPGPGPTMPQTDVPPTRNTPSADPSERLHTDKGVVRPPENVDPSMTKPTPRTGTTPVIPPPGTPGGNPDVQPR